jgi:polyphosphate kinase
MSQQERPSPAATIEEMQNDRPYLEPIAKKAYKRDLKALQIELLKLQRHIKLAGERVVILFEGRDAAGKGGAIKRFRQHLNPRGSEHVALPKPNDAEATQWYFQRYVQHLPSAGDITMFDRSWYNRAGVEKVMGFCTPQEHALFLRQVPGFEQSLVSSGIRLFKMWFTVSRGRQSQRFDARREDPLKQWKLSPIDEVSVAKYDAYTAARNEMLLATDTLVAPWTIVNSNEKRRARLGAIRSVLQALDYEHKDHDAVGEPDPRVVRTAHSVFIDNGTRAGFGSP